MNIMTKRGSQDNVVTYEHYCDTKEDLTAIPSDQITLGSTAVVLKDEGDAMGVYMANSSKEWIPFSSVGNAGGGSSGGSTGGVMVVHSEFTGADEQLDKTWQEIFDAIKSGMLVIRHTVTEVEAFTSASYEFIFAANHDNDDDTFDVYIGPDKYSATSSDGYPELKGNIG